MAESKFKKGEKYSAVRKETKEKVELIGVNQEADLVIVNSIPGTIDKLSNFNGVKPDGKLSKEESSARDESFGSNWDN